MTFKRVAPQVVEHSSGFKVQGSDRFHLRYIENRREVLIPVEDRAVSTYEIYWDKIQGWEPPYDKQDLSKEDITRIKENVLSALTFQNL